MSRSSLRKQRRKLTTELIAAGQHTRRSHYQTAEIADAVRSDLAAMRAQMESQRNRALDRDWAFRKESAKRPETPLLEVT